MSQALDEALSQSLPENGFVIKVRFQQFLTHRSLEAIDTGIDFQTCDIEEQFAGKGVSICVKALGLDNRKPLCGITRGRDYSLSLA